MMERKIKHVHFQITRNCNLRCSFCGQWGKKGFFADSAGTAMTLADWKKIISELKAYRECHGENITVTVWGGEPLVSPYFDEIMFELKENGFKTEVITNGVLINRHINVLNGCADILYVSIDGTSRIHNAVRGENVYETVTENLKKLNHKNVTVMSVITPGLTEVIDEFLGELDGLGIKRLYLQDMIGLSERETREYKICMEELFGIKAHDIDSWRNDDLFKTDSIKTGNHSYEIEHKIHTAEGCCKSPFYHLHIAWNGNVMYCTDFYDFSAGNVKSEKLEDIFTNEKSELYRKKIIDGGFPACAHCSWKSTEWK